MSGKWDRMAGGKWKSIEVEIMSFVAGKLMMIIDRVVQSSAEMTV